MSIQFACGCGKRYSVKEDLAGKRVKCAACGTTLEVPTASVAPATAPASATPATKIASAKVGNSKAGGAKIDTGSPIAKSAAPAAQAAPSDPDDYQLDTGPVPTVAASKTPLKSGHQVQPKVDADAGDFELEPPVEVKVTIDYFLDDAELPAAKSPAASASPARKRASGQVSADAMKAAEGLTVAEEEKAPQEPTVPCPSCGAQIKQNAVLCVHCGLNLKTGEKLEAAPIKKAGLGGLFRRK